MGSQDRKLTPTYRATRTVRIRYPLAGRFMRMDLHLEGQVLTTWVPGYAVSLLTDRGTEIQIENEFTLRHGGEHKQVKPDVNLDFPVELQQQMITRSVIEESGTLDISFDNGVAIRVPPDNDYEAWNITGPTRKYVCGPGGEIVTWGA